MCEANAYIINKNGEECLFLEAVDSITETEGGLLLENIFCERKVFNGRIKALALVSHKIILEE